MVSLSPTIGKIFGIPIQLHWTFLGLMLLALILLATSPGGLFFFALLVLLFVCVLIHELAHSVVAIRNDIKVKKIILLPIGGASIIDFTKVKPGKELKISLAGPLTSIALGLIFVPFYLIAPGAGILKQGLQFLFEINLLLGVFNLLPGFPLDGGRVLRSYLERRHSPLDSTKIAVKASNIVVVGIVVGTIIYAAVIPNATFTYREFLVLFDVIIALFLYDGAKAELQSAIFKSRARNVAAADAATKNFILVTPQMRLSSLYKEMVRKGTNIVLLKKGNRFIVFASISAVTLGGLNLVKTNMEDASNSLTGSDS
ncbi:MAG: site-2 protease family protein, partial [Candidatus Marsarchaeota archaeon]|nr:site-2 protease family protein [Candidatus Marsarchaeota archaeon]